MALIRTIALLLAAATLAGPAARASAQEDCGVDVRRGPLEVTPLNGPFPVTLGAPVKVRYSPGYFDDPSIGAVPEDSISLWVRDTGAPVAGTVQVIGDTLVFLPDLPFEPRTEYEGNAFGIDADLEIHFTAGVAFDTGPPDLGNVLSMTAASVGESCDAPGGGYRIDVSFAPAIDDGPPGDIEYLLYVSRGPEVEAPELRARVRNLTPSEVIMAFVIDPSEAVSPICVTVHAIDGVGNIDDDGVPYCDDPIKGNFFAPLCSATSSATVRGAAGGAGQVGWGLAVCLGLLLVLRRGGRRRR